MTLQLALQWAFCSMLLVGVGLCSVGALRASLRVVGLKTRSLR